MDKCRGFGRLPCSETRPDAGDPPTTVAGAFDRLDEALRLDRGELAEARAFHDQITQQLKELGLIRDAFLQGSLARKTMVAPLRDVDKSANRT